MKRLFCVLTAVCVFGLTCGCGEKNDDGETSQSSSQTQSDGIFNLSANDIIKSMEEKTVDFPECTQISSHDEKGVETDGWADSFSALYDDFSADKVKEFSIKFSNEATADEITVVVLKSKDDAEDLKTVMKNYISSRLNQFESYAPEEVPKLRKAKIVSKENIVALIVCDNPDEVSQGFKKAFS